VLLNVFAGLFMPFHLYSPWGATLMSLRACAMDWGRNRILRVGKYFGDILSRLWTKICEIMRQRRRPLALSETLADYLCHVSFRRHSTFSLEVVEKPNKCKSSPPPIFGEEQPRLFHGIVRAISCPPFGKVWFSFVCWLSFAKPGNEVTCRI